MFDRFRRLIRAFRVPELGTCYVCPERRSGAYNGVLGCHVLARFPLLVVFAKGGSLFTYRLVSYQLVKRGRLNFSTALSTTFGRAYFLSFAWVRGRCAQVRVVALGGPSFRGPATVVVGRANGLTTLRVRVVGFDEIGSTSGVVIGVRGPIEGTIRGINVGSWRATKNGANVRVNSKRVLYGCVKCIG